MVNSEAWAKERDRLLEELYASPNPVNVEELVKFETPETWADWEANYTPKQALEYYLMIRDDEGTLEFDTLENMMQRLAEL